MGEIEQIMEKNTSVLASIFYVIWKFIYRIADKLASFLDR